MKPHTTKGTRVITTGAGNYTRPNPRGCPGSYAKVRADDHGRGVCPYCYKDFRVSADGALRAHPRAR